MFFIPLLGHMFQEKQEVSQKQSAIILFAKLSWNFLELFYILSTHFELDFLKL
jgi:hypothetical protein